MILDIARNSKTCCCGIKWTWARKQVMQFKGFNITPAKHQFIDHHPLCLKTPADDLVTPKMTFSCLRDADWPRLPYAIGPWTCPKTLQACLCGLAEYCWQFQYQDRSPLTSLRWGQCVSWLMSSPLATRGAPLFGSALQNNWRFSLTQILPWKFLLLSSFTHPQLYPFNTNTVDPCCQNCLRSEHSTLLALILSWSLHSTPHLAVSNISRP